MATLFTPVAQVFKGSWSLIRSAIKMLKKAPGESRSPAARLRDAALHFNREMLLQSIAAKSYFDHHEKPQEEKPRWQYLHNAHHDFLYRDGVLQRKIVGLGSALGLLFAWDLVSNIVIAPINLYTLGLPSNWQVKVHSWFSDSAAAVANSPLASKDGAANAARQASSFFDTFGTQALLAGLGLVFVLSFVVPMFSSSFSASNRRAAKSADGMWWMSSRLPMWSFKLVGSLAMAVQFALGKISLSPSLAAWLKDKRGLDDVRSEALWRVLFPGTPDQHSLERDAMAKWPPEDYPSLYIKGQPKDIARSIVVYGRVITGDEPGALFSGATSPREAGAALRVGLATGFVYAIAALLAYHPNLYFNWARWFTSSVVEIQASRIQGAMGLAHADAISLAASQVGATLNSFWLGHGWLTAIAMGLFMGCVATRRALRSAIESAPEAAAQDYKIRDIHGEVVDQVLYYTGTQEQIKLFPEERNAILNHERNDAIASKRLTSWDRGEIFTFGRSTGELFSKGRIGAPMKDAPIGNSDIDRLQNTVVFGGTGAGKTVKIIKRKLKWFLKQRQRHLADVQRMSATPLNLQKFTAPASYPERRSMLLMDGKSELYGAMTPMAEAAGQKVLVIGFQPSEYVIDLLDGLPPQLVAAFLKSMASQMGANSTDSFWPDQAALFIERAARVAQAFDVTDGGMEWCAVERVRPYSLRFIYELLSDLTGERLSYCFNAIAHCFQTDPVRFADADIDTEILFASFRELNDKWINETAETTRSNIQSNIDNMLKPITSDSNLRATFAAGNGRGGQFMKAKDFWGNITATNIKSSDGSGGAMVLTFIKTLFMYEALKRQGVMNRETAAYERKFMGHEAFMLALAHVLPKLCKKAMDDLRMEEDFHLNQSAQLEVENLRSLTSLGREFIPVFSTALKIAVDKSKPLAVAKALKMPENYNSSVEFVYQLIAALRGAHAKASQGLLEGSIREFAKLTADEVEAFNRYEAAIMSASVGSSMLKARSLAEAKFEALKVRAWDDAFGGDDVGGEYSETALPDGVSASSVLRSLPSGIATRELGAVRSHYDTPKERLRDVIEALRSLERQAAKKAHGFSPEDIQAATLTDEESQAFSDYLTRNAHSAGAASVADLARFSFKDVMECQGGEETFTNLIEGDEDLLAAYYAWRDNTGLMSKGIAPKLMRDLIFFVCDEHQQVITVDSKAGAAYTDSGFWNVSRSAGVAGFLCTQTITTYYTAVGNKDIVDSMLEQMRTKICLPSDDMVLMSMFKELAGTMRREAPRTGSKYARLNRDLTFGARMEARALARNPEFAIFGVAPKRVLGQASELIKGSWNLADVFNEPRSSLQLGESAVESDEAYQFAGQVHTSFANGSRQSNEDTINAQRQQARDAAKAVQDKYIERECEEEDAFDAALFRSNAEGRAAVSIMRGNRAVFDYIDAK